MLLRGALLRYILVALILTGLTGPTRGADAPPSDDRELGSQSESACAHHACGQANCATVLTVYHRDPWEPSAPFTAHGLSRNPPFGATNPNVPLVTQPSSTVQRRRDVWVIEVCRRDGTIQVIEQSYPALLQPGDEVQIDGDRVRVRD